MKESSAKRFTRILTAAGVLLVAAAVLLVIASQITQDRAGKKTALFGTKVRALMPETVDRVPDDRTDMTMPMVEIDGLNFIGIIDVPAYGTSLPICESWDPSRLSDFPCRYTGSMYDGSLIVGGRDHSNSFCFIKEITGGDLVYVTDMTGARYTYVVTDIQKTRDVSTAQLTGDADLTLFARNSLSFDYTVIRCVLNARTEAP